MPDTKIKPFISGNFANLSSLQREIAKDSQDFLLYPAGGSGYGMGSDRSGVVTPDMFDPLLGMPRYELDGHWPGASLGYGSDIYQLYRFVAAHHKVSACIQQRNDTTIEREWIVEPGGTDDIDEQAADHVRDYLSGGLYTPEHPDGFMVLPDPFSFDSLQLSMLDANLMGFSALEMMWNRDGRQVYPSSAKFKPQHRFNMYLGEVGWEPRLLTIDNQIEGIPIPDRKFLFYRYRSNAGPFGQGLAYELSPLVYDGKDGLKFFVVHAQRYAGPTVFIMVPPNASDEMIDEARATAENIGQEAANTLPAGMGIEVVEGKVGSSSTYNDLLHYIDAQIAQLTLGQTGTIDQSDGGGSRARDEVADVQTLRKSKADSDLTCLYLRETLLRWTTEHNYPGAKIPKLYRPYPELQESEDAIAMAERDSKIAIFTGRQLKKEWLEKRHNVEFEEGQLELFPKGSKIGQLPGKSDRPVEEPSPNLGEGELRNDPSQSGWSEQLHQRSRPYIDEFLFSVRTAITSSDDYDDLIKALGAIASDTSISEKWGREIALSMILASGLGAADVQEEVSEGVGLAEGVDPLMRFESAIDQIKNRVPWPTERWDEIEGEAQAWAFTVAGVTQIDALEQIQTQVGRSLDEQISYADFKEGVEDIVKKSGLTPLSPWRIELVHNQNISNAYQAGRYERQHDPSFQAIAPYSVYKHGGSADPRPAHLALNDFVAKADDPIWATIYPPNGFNCSCRVFSLTEGQFKRRGLTLSDPLPTVDGAPVVEGEAIAEKGFSSSPGRVPSKEIARQYADIAGGKNKIETPPPPPPVKPSKKTAKKRPKPTKPVKRPVTAKEFKALVPKEIKQLADNKGEAIAQIENEIQKIGEQKKDILVQIRRAQLSNDTKKLASLYSNVPELDAKFMALEKKKVKEESKGAQKILDLLYKRSPVSEAEASKWLGKINKSHIEYQMMPAAVREQNEEALKDAYRLYGGELNLPELRFVDDRAHFNAYAGYLNPGKGSSRGIQFHELAHSLEYARQGVLWSDSKAYSLSQEAANRRSAVSKEWRLSRASSIEKYELYQEGSGEWAYPGDYIDKYVGKVYTVNTAFDGEKEKESSEVISMGMEQFASPKSLKKLIEADRDMFELMVGIIIDAQNKD